MKKQIAIDLLLVIASAVLSALGLYVFVYPSNFAPSGMDGIATMLQKLTGLSAGYYSLMINLPLLAVAWFFLKKKYVIYTVTFMILSSLLIVLLGEIKFYQYTDDPTLAAVFSGAILGFRLGVMLRIGASTGGTDIVAGMIKRKHEHWNVERVLCIICYIIIAVSYFVYWDLNCILLAVLQTFVYEKVAAAVLKDTRNATEFKIVTADPEALSEEILNRLKHGVTVMEAKGMYTKQDKYMVFAVVNNRQIPEFFKIIAEHPDVFVYYSDVAGVRGNFRWR